MVIADDPEYDSFSGNGKGDAGSVKALTAGICLERIDVGRPDVEMTKLPTHSRVQPERHVWSRLGRERIHAFGGIGQIGRDRVR